MLAKMLMCSCFVEKFYSEGNGYVKKLCHFYCKCNDQHLMHILFCEKYPYGSAHTPEMEEKCNCPFIGAYDIYDFCIQVKHLLNFKACKFCLKRISESIQEQMETTHQYFKRMKSCQPFFSFNKQRNRVDIYLDNPKEPNILVKTDD